MIKTQHSCVYLDLSHLDAAYLRQRFPGIDRLCRGFDLDFTCDPIPVRPGAHYMIGGVTVDVQGRTSLPGLWAAGEVTSSGLHWREPACLEQPARRPRLRGTCRGRHRRDARFGGRDAPRGAHDRRRASRRKARGA